jgi:polysaccharide export outer membrane protein
VRRTIISFVHAGLAVTIASAVFISGCASKRPSQSSADVQEAEPYSYEYHVGPGDRLDIFVWRNPDISVHGVPVRPDGRVSIPLVEDLQVSGKMPTEIAREIEGILSRYIKDPFVTVTVVDFVGQYSEQIRVVGAAANPRALPYRDNMTVLDVLISVGGLTEFAAGNKAALIRTEEGDQRTIRLRLKDLLEDGDIGANMAVRPGDVLLIPESAF